MSKVISIGLAFGGVVLPIVEGADGFQRVPLKPICEVVGVEWERQRKRVQEGYLSRRFGTCTPLMYWAGQEIGIDPDLLVARSGDGQGDLFREAG